MTFLEKLRRALTTGCLLVLALPAIAEPPVNLLVNPDFDTDLADWTQIVPSSKTFLHDPADSSGDSASGSAAIAASQAIGTFYRLIQCVPAEEATSYHIAGRAWAEAENANLSFLGFVRFFATDGCSGERIGTGSSQVLHGDTAGQWLSFAGSVPSPAGTRAAEAEYLFSASNLQQFAGKFDHLVFFRDGLFADGFESGDTTGWSSPPALRVEKTDAAPRWPFR